jgi:hypothetical protein
MLLSKSWVYQDAADLSGVQFGSWRFIKSEGVSEIDTKIRYLFDGAAAGHEHVDLYLFAQNEIHYDNQTANFTVGSRLYGLTSGARALILADSDSGTSGYLQLSHLEGIFEDNETIVDAAGGSALAYGTTTYPGGTRYLATYRHELTWVADTWEWANHTFTGLSSNEAEYELVIKGNKSSGTVHHFYLSNLFVTDDLIGGSTEVTHQLPSMYQCHRNDDCKAQMLSDINSTLKQANDRNTKILVNDYLQPLIFVDSERYAMLTHGVVYPSYRSRYLLCRAIIEKPNRSSRAKVDFNSATGAFTAGENIYQQVSPDGGTNWITVASAKVVVCDTPAAGAGTVYLKDVQGSFQGSNSLSESTMVRIYGDFSTSVAGTDWAQSSVAPSMIHTRLKFGILLDASTIAYSDAMVEFTDQDTAGLGDSEGLVEVTLRVPIPRAYWNDCSDDGSMPGPLVFVLMSQNNVGSTTNAYDVVRLLSSVVYEQPQTVLED